MLQKLAAADVWVALDDAQYVPREWQNRTTIVPTHGARLPFWLTLPIPRTDHPRPKICEVSPMAPEALARYVRLTLFHAFHRASHWPAIEEVLCESRLDVSLESLTGAGVATTQALLSSSGFAPRLILSSTLRAKGKASGWMAAICRELGATTYLADSGAISYLDQADFGGMEILWQHWSEPQGRYDEIATWRDLSALNLVAREGQGALFDHLASQSFESAPPVSPQLTV